LLEQCSESSLNVTLALLNWVRLALFKLLNQSDEA